MSAAKKLSDDMDLIKEFESLKLKQSLLLESLKHKHKQEENDKEIKEVHSIVQQLLDVFLEAKENKNKSDETNEEDETSKEDPLTRIEGKIDALQKDVSDLQMKISSNESSSKNTTANTTSNSNSTDNISEKLDVFNKSKGPEEEKDKKSEQSSNNNIPPIPKSWGTNTNGGDNKL